jgi:integrase
LTVGVSPAEEKNMKNEEHAPYSLTTRKGSPFIYVQFWNEELQKYESARSTGKTTKKAAGNVAIAWLKEFNGPPPVDRKEEDADRVLVTTMRKFLEKKGLVDKKENLSTERILHLVSLHLMGETFESQNPVFTDYLLDFWDWESSMYVKDKLDNGQRIGKQYVRSNQQKIRQYAIPFFGSMRIKSVTTHQLEKFKNTLPRKTEDKDGLSASSINSIVSCVGTALAEASRLGIILENPSLGMRKLVKRGQPRGILESSEVSKLFALSWDDKRCKLASQVAACHGLRAGEIGALRIEDIDSDKKVIKVNHSWDRQNRCLKTPKNGQARYVYTEESIIKELIQLHNENPHNNGFIFWNLDKDNEPMNLDNFRDSLQKMLLKIGLSKSEQESRKIDFHSWRHFSNSMLRGAIPDSLLRQVIGHNSQEMTDRYSHLSEQQGNEYRNSVKEHILPFVLGEVSA